MNQATEDTAPSLEERLEFWLMEHGKTLAYVIVVALLCVLAAFQWTRSQRLRAEGDYLQAETAFATYAQQSETELGAAALETLRESMARHPELAARYQGVLAQSLLVDGDMATAVQLASDAVARQPVEMYRSYAEGTLLIANGQFAEALRGALQQRDALDLSTDSVDTHVLEGMLALRVASLHQELGNRQEELAMWRELKASLQSSTTPEALLESTTKQQAYQQVAALFQSGQLNLLDFIDKRIEVLG